MLRVIRKHRAAVGNIDAALVPDDMLKRLARAWDEALAIGEEHGYRNAQATVLAPTGTICFMMDCDTTGIEPDFSLVKSKRLVGGGDITIVNQTVPVALAKLGYAPHEIDQIVAYVNEHNTVVGAPGFKGEHMSVFDVAVGDRAIHHMGHVNMMASVQPFLSGAISKTVNVPTEVTVDDIAQLYMDAWKLGVKAIAIYRDGCKVAQPLQTKGSEQQLAGRQAVAADDADRPQRGGAQVPGRRVRGLHPRRPLPRGRPRRHLRRHRQGGDDAGRPHERVHDRGLGRDPVRRAARGVRLEVRPHAVRAVGDDERSRHPHRQVDPRLHLPLDGQALPRRRDAGRARHHERRRCASSSRPATVTRRRCRPRRAEPSGTPAPGVGQTALFNAWEDAVECAKCGGRKVRTGACYTCRDCGDNSGCG